MPRHEFSKAIKREALKRSEHRCEAAGEVYGLVPGHRCNGDLGHGVEFDHYPVPATDPGSDKLENCVAACKTCHRFKTSTYDVPMQAKGKRISDKHNGISRPKHQWGAQRLGNGNQQHTATRPIIRKTELTQ